MKEFSHTRSGRTTDTDRPVHAPNAALMIDFDNVTMGIRSDLQNQLRRLLNSEIIKGKVAVQRAYADWRRYPQYIVPLSEASIDLIFAPAFGSNKKNATDIRLAIDALELVFTRPEIGIFILLSGDSDFSSLVLKLKEYGKYVIGVGLRESSSDLLIQNCDEYFSYTEVTGLTKEGDGETTRRDPWELVVEAVTQMKRESDVMRSDRLKQVMQSMDPNFDEKDAGCNRFSKFVVEAGQRGLLAIEKMDNGQYAVDVGDNANLPPDEEAELRKESSGGDRAGKSRRRRGGGRRKTEDSGSEMTLSAAFDLLRKVLADASAPEEGVDAEAVHASIIKAHGDDGDPMFERRRFQRMLRQAHDANVVELAKVDGAYRLKPGAEVKAGDAQADVADNADAKNGPKATEPSGSGTKGTRSKKSTRSRSRGSRKKSDGDDAASASANTTEPEKEKTPPASPQEKPAAESATKSAPTSDARKRNPRFRRGTRGGAAKPRKESGEVALPGKVADESSTATAASQAKPDESRAPAKPEEEKAKSSVGGRGGRSRGRRPQRSAEERTAQSKDAEPSAPSGRASGSDTTAAAAPPASPPRQQPDTASTPPAQQPSLFDGGGAGDDESLFRRMSAALQRVMRGTEDE